MEYRGIKDSELDQVLKIRDYCFPKTYTGSKLEDFKYWAKVSKAIGAFDEESLAGQLMVLPLKMNLHGQVYDMGGIAFVATYPEYRNSGVMKQLIKRSLEEMRKQEQWVSVLGPFSVSFYRHFGWELFFDKVHYHFPTHLFAAKKGTMGRIVRFNYQEKRSYLAQVKELYQTYAVQTNGMMLREEDWWNRLEMREPETAFALSYDEFEKLRGYIRYVKRGRTFEVLESIFLTVEAERALWSYIGTHRANFTEVVGTAAVQDSFGVHWDEPQFPKEVTHDVMIRIVDIEPFLSVYPFKENNYRLYLSVTDAFAPWNQGVYVIDSGKVRKAGEGEVPVDECLEMDISSLSSYLAGYHHLKWYRYHGKAQVNEEALKVWEEVVPKEQPRFYGHF